MAIVNALRFDEHRGAVIADSESWFLRRRKTYFPPPLHEIEAPGNRGPRAVLGAVGDPNYHREVILRVRESLGAQEPDSMEALGRLVLDAMHAATRRIAGDRLRFLFGFGLDDLNRGRFERGGETFGIRTDSIRKRARRIAEGKETPAGRDLIPPNQACLMGTEIDGTLRMFCLKETDGVLSFNAGGFESLGKGKYAGGMRLGGALGERTLEDRRNGFAPAEGLLLLFDSLLEASEHFGQVGGRPHLVLADGTRPVSQRIRRTDPDRALLGLEIAKACRGGFLEPQRGMELIESDVIGTRSLRTAEKDFFRSARDAGALELYLRGYKTARKASPKKKRKARRK
jgi:hypothetical protein